MSSGHGHPWLFGVLVASYQVNALAQSFCPIRVVPPNAGADWDAAVQQASQRIQSASPKDTDCREVVVEVGDDGGRVSITTTDGRIATRPVKSPDDVAPVIRALLVTVPPGRPAVEPTTSETARPKAPSPAPPPARSLRESPQDRVVRGTAVHGPRRMHVIIALGGGSRIGFSSGWVGASPIARIWAGVLAGLFEFGVSCSRDFVYGTLSGSLPASVQMTAATEAGLFAGFRPVLGPIHATLGLQLGASFLEEKITSNDVQSSDNAQGQQSAVHPYKPVQALAGAYVGTLVPIVSWLQLRTQLELDGAPTHFGGFLAPEWPVWWGAFVLALEGNLP